MFVWSCLILFQLFFLMCNCTTYGGLMGVEYWSDYYTCIVHLTCIGETLYNGCQQVVSNFTKCHNIPSRGTGARVISSPLSVEVSATLTPKPIVSCLKNWCDTVSWLNTGGLWKHHETLPFPPCECLNFCVWIVWSQSSRAGGWECFIEAGGKATP